MVELMYPKNGVQCCESVGVHSDAFEDLDIVETREGEYQRVMDVHLHSCN